MDKKKSYEISDPQKNLYILLRNYACKELCPGGSIMCMNLECIELFLRQAGCIENEIIKK
jgi:hypothetical protein